MKTTTQFTSILSVSLLGLVAPIASASTLINENFDDITGLTDSTSVRSVSDILANNPAQLSTGAQWLASSATAGSGNVAYLDDVNVRRGDNSINTNTGAAGFDSYFSTNSSNNFLVLGNRVGAVSAANTGDGSKGAFRFSIPFLAPADASDISVGFDWAFDGADTFNPVDNFKAGIAGNGFDITSSASHPFYALSLPLTLVDLSTTNQATIADSASGNATGNVNALVSLSGLPAADANGYRYLVFSLSEHAGGQTNTAAGIDNIQVSAVPVPSAVWLFGSAVMGLIGMGRRKQTV